MQVYVVDTALPQQERFWSYALEGVNGIFVLLTSHL